jgi:outer membrane protein assembly factor BamB
MTGRQGSSVQGARSRAVCAALLCAAALCGCADSLAGMSLPSLPKIGDINPFAEKEVPLPGKRVAVMQQENISVDLASANKPISVPTPRANDEWTQPGGMASNAPIHLVLGSSVKTSWSADAGTGSSFYGKLTASPIVYDNKVFTLDAAGKVSAFSTSAGSLVWRESITPPSEKEQEGFGGGLAIDSGRLYAATGYGYVVALDPKSGKKLWEKSVDSPIRSSPTAAGDRIFVVSKEGVTYCLSGTDGSEMWNFRGVVEKASILSNASPAIDGDIVIVPYPSGELVALRVSNGQPAWSESLSRTHTGSSLSALSDAARPVIDGGTVFAVGHAGRMIASVDKTGEQLWSLTVPGIQAPWVAGDTVFVVDITGQLMAITRRDGKIQWTTKLAGASTWSGPVLAGDRLWLTSIKGQLVSVEPATGKVATTQELGQPILIAPVVASGRMYVLTDKAKLIALN